MKMQIKQATFIAGHKVYEFQRSRDVWASAKIVPTPRGQPERFVFVLTNLGSFVMTDTSKGPVFEIENEAVVKGLESFVQDMGPVDPQRHGETSDKAAFDQLSERFHESASVMHTIYEASCNADRLEGRGGSVVMGRFTSAKEADAAVLGMQGRVSEGHVYESFDAWANSTAADPYRDEHPLLNPKKKLAVQAYNKLTPEERDALGLKKPY